MKKYAVFMLMAFLTTFCALGVDLKDITSYKCGDSEDEVKYTIKYHKNNTLKTLTATKEAYIVNEGFGRLSRSVVFKDKVGNILDGHLLVISSKK